MIFENDEEVISENDEEKDIDPNCLFFIDKIKTIVTFKIKKKRREDWRDFHFPSIFKGCQKKVCHE